MKLIQKILLVIFWSIAIFLIVFISKDTGGAVCLTVFLVFGIALFPSVPYISKMFPEVKYYIHKKILFRSFYNEKCITFTENNLMELPSAIDVTLLKNLKSKIFSPFELEKELKKINFNREEIDTIFLYLSPVPVVVNLYEKGCAFAERGDYKTAIKCFNKISKKDRQFKMAQKKKKILEDMIKM